MWTPLNISVRTFVSARSLHPKKFTSILADVPVRPRNPWQIYLRENYANYKNEHGKIDTQTATKELSKKWKVLGEAEKQKFIDIYHKENQIHLKALDEALNNATPKQFREENILRAKYNLTKLKDPKAPKPPRNSFLLYLDHFRKTNPELIEKNDIKEVAIMATKKYKQADSNELKYFVDTAKRLMLDYKLKKIEYDAIAKLGGNKLK